MLSDFVAAHSCSWSLTREGNARLLPSFLLLATADAAAVCHHGAGATPCRPRQQGGCAAHAAFAVRQTIQIQLGTASVQVGDQADLPLDISRSTTANVDNEPADYANDHIYIKADRDEPEQ